MRVWWGFKMREMGLGLFCKRSFKGLAKGLRKAFLVRGFDTFSIQKV